MALYTPESVERVKEAIDMVDLVGSRTELRRAGANRLEGLCPFHEERTPSFGIDPVQKLYHCFGCGEGGDAITFVKETEGVDFKGAIELLADRYGIELELAEEDPQEAERRKRRERLHALLDRTATFYTRYLWESDEARKAREYLLERGLTEEALREFRVGYAPSAWDTLLRMTSKAGFSARELYDAGLSQRAKGEGRLYDRFRARIMFPLADTRGRVVGFGARKMSGDDKGPKYLNTSENDLFHKGRHLYAADLARAAAAKAGAIIVAEGYTDVIAMHQAGLKNTVAIMGTSLTEDQVVALGRLAPVAHLALDADNAGQEAMLRAAKVAARSNLELRVVPMPEGADPADLVAREGADSVRGLVQGSMPFVRFRVLRELRKGDLSSAEGKDRVLDELRPVFATLAPSVLREELLRLAADRLDLTEPLLASLLAQAPSRRPAQPPPRDAPEQPAPPRRQAAPPPRAVSATEAIERSFLTQCIALGGTGRDELSRLNPEEHFTSELMARAARHLAQHIAAPTQGIDPGDEELTALVRELSVRAAREPATPDTLDAQRLQLELRRIDRKMAEARRAGGDGATDLATRRAKLKAEFDRAIERATGTGA